MSPVDRESPTDAAGQSEVPRGLLIGRVGLRHTALVPRLLNEAVALQERLRAIGGTAPPLGQILRDLDLVDEPTVEHMLAWQRDGAPPEDDRLGALATLNGFSTRERVRRALERQEAGVIQGDPPQRLGELLVASGDLTPQAVRALLAAQARLRGRPSPSGGDSGTWEVVPGGYRVRGEMLMLEQAALADELEPLPVWLIVLLCMAAASVVAVIVFAVIG